MTTKTFALWECPNCDGISVLRERYRDKIPEHIHCSPMVYIRDVTKEIGDK